MGSIVVAASLKGSSPGPLEGSVEEVSGTVIGSAHTSFGVGIDLVEGASVVVAKGSPSDSPPHLER